MNTRVGIFLTLFSLVTGMTLSSPGSAAETRIEQTHSSLTYQGTWQTVNSSTVSGGSIAASNQAGASVTVRFRGSAIKWLGYRCPCAGIARVYVDGILAQTVDTYAATQQPLTEIYRISGLSTNGINDVHELKIEVTGTASSGASDRYIGVDAFNIESDTWMFEETDGAVSYTGAWLNVAMAGASGGSLAAAREAGASATVRFKGTAIDWIGAKCPCAGGARIYLDGGFIDSIDTYGPALSTGETIYMLDGLSDSEHTLRIEATGVANSAGSNSYVGVDAFRVTLGDGGGIAIDTIPPGVTLTSPAEDANVTGMVTISAAASDNVGVTRVEFYAAGSGGEVFLGEDLTAPYSITRDTSSVPSGSSFFVSARAYDAAGNVGTSGVNVTVQHGDGQPTINITVPADGSTVSRTIRFAATVSGKIPEGYVANFVPGGSSAIEPYEVLVDTTGFHDGTERFSAVLAPEGYTNFPIRDFIDVTVDNRIQPGITRVDDAESSIAYTGAWTTTMGFDRFGQRIFHWDSIHHSDKAGGTVTFTFEGVGVRWLGEPCDTCGIATVSLDGGAGQTVHLDGAQPLFSTTSGVVYTSPLVPYGIHTLQITVENHPVPPYGQLENTITVDGFEVIKSTDITAPTALIGGVHEGDTLTGTVTLTATASDDVGVAKVQFYAGELIGEDTTAPYSVTWDSRLSPNGEAYIYAIAVDGAGNRSTVSQVDSAGRTTFPGEFLVNIWNGPGTAPSLVVTAPAEGVTVSGVIAVSAEAFHPDGIREVGFNIVNSTGSSVRSSSDTTAPYSTSWDTTQVANGVYTIHTRISAGTDHYTGNFNGATRQIVVDNH